jgi:hypothetical protein
MKMKTTNQKSACCRSAEIHFAFFILFVVIVMAVIIMIVTGGRAEPRET